MLPKKIDQISNGGVYHQAVKCGKANCRCSRGELHSGYYYFFTRMERRLKKIYIPKQMVNAVADLAENAAATRRAARHMTSESLGKLREFRMRLREIEAQD